ncbi:MAG: lytic transglycosylase domain-containing protein [Alphaproteobacteria bacterium PRO2]|nr:lytic transglycosylase domain-containing protein [Alphaproteobacteria bacterium PRO2]
MDNAANSIQNNALATLLAPVPGKVVNAIQKASARTGVDFAYLVQQAGAESSFNPKIKAKSSSASGLYQFIESTWLNMVKKHGDKYGMGALADKIGDNGKVANRAVRKEILALRNDPEKASAMAAEFARENEQFLNSHWGGEVGSTELYFAHFLGAGQASAFLRERDENPLQKAAYLFPAAAKANRNVFYDKATGRAKTMDEVYAFFDKKFDLKETNVPGFELPPVPPQKPVQIAQAQLPIKSNVFIGGVNRTGSLYNDAFYANMPTPPNDGYASLAAQKLATNPVEIMLLSQLDSPFDKASSFKLND